jgi:hypothetical protein
VGSFTQDFAAVAGLAPLKIQRNHIISLLINLIDRPSLGIAKEQAMIKSGASNNGSYMVK